MRTFLFYVMLVTILAFYSCGNSQEAENHSDKTSTTSTTTTTRDRKETPSTPTANASDKVQACSYDGEPTSVSSSNSYTNTSATVSAINNIMKFTGLPQNFKIIETKEVPNAAAIILRDKSSGLPTRVIAYNPKFMKVVKDATHGSEWAPISILAHEIGHHLCGHTILPGGSQPPTELEADKFSGFVLYKMGAELQQAQLAMNTLVPDRDSPTHPRRSKRVRAIKDGWQQACTQQSDDCSGAHAKKEVKNTASEKQTPQADTKEEVASNEKRNPVTKPAVKHPATTTKVVADKLPKPKTTSIPNKFDKFVYDELGVMDDAAKKDLEATLFNYAKDKNVEIVLLVVDNLNGLSADEYAGKMLRELRVGQLELGNGACLVVAPNQKQIGVGLMAGLQFEIDESRVKNIKSKLGHFMNDYILKGNSGYLRSGKDAAKRIIDLSKFFEWVVKYENLEAILKADKVERKAHVSPRDSKTWLKLVRVTGTLTSKNGFKTIPDKFSNQHAIPKNGYEMEVKTESGKSIIVYATPLAESIMTSRLNTGKTYSFVLRAKELYGDYPSFQLVSYDVLN